MPIEPVVYCPVSMAVGAKKERERLWNYLQHDPTCVLQPRVHPQQQGCTCGLRDLVTGNKHD